MAQDQILLKRRSAEIEIAILQAQLLIDLCLRGDLKGRRLGLRQNAQLGDINFDMACRDLIGLALTLANLTLCHDDVFGFAGCSLLKERLVGRIVKGQLYNARAVAQDDKENTALIAHSIDKAADCDGLARFQHLAAIAGALHSLHVVHGSKTPYRKYSKANANVAPQFAGLPYLIRVYIRIVLHQPEDKIQYKQAEYKCCHRHRYSAELFAV